MESAKGKRKATLEKVKETSIKEKLAKKFKGVKLTPRKIRSIIDEIPDIDVDTQESDSDAESVYVESETAAESLDSEVSGVSEIGSSESESDAGGSEEGSEGDNDVDIAAEADLSLPSTSGQTRAPRARARARGRAWRARGPGRALRTTSRDDSAWSTDNTEPFVEIFTGTPGMTVPVPVTALGFI